MNGHLQDIADCIQELPQSSMVCSPNWVWRGKDVACQWSPYKEGFTVWHFIIRKASWYFEEWAKWVLFVTTFSVKEDNVMQQSIGICVSKLNAFCTSAFGKHSWLLVYFLVGRRRLTRVPFGMCPVPQLLKSCTMALCSYWLDPPYGGPGFSPDQCMWVCVDCHGHHCSCVLSVVHGDAIKHSCHGYWVCCLRCTHWGRRNGCWACKT